MPLFGLFSGQQKDKAEDRNYDPSHTSAFLFPWLNYDAGRGVPVGSLLETVRR